MARIRTIKPEFWTDEVVVQLPFEARLLFIGMWNFADDTGALEYSPDRIRLQILPAERDCDITGLIDLLAAAGLIEYWVGDTGSIEALTINGWAKHQKIDNPSRKSVIRENYRKRAIPSEERVSVAKKYGCKPGGTVEASCYYCGMPGHIHWWTGQNNKPIRWITLSDLEFDHFISEHSGGDSTAKNLVLSCRCCNRGKREFDPHQFFAIKNPSVVLDSHSEGSSLDQGKDQGPRTKDQGSLAPVAPEWLPADRLEAFRKHRKALGKRLTEEGERLLIAKLGRLRAQGYDPVELLNESITNGWLGVFPGKSKPKQKRSAEERAARVNALLYPQEKDVIDA